MKPERYKQVKEVFAAAVECETGERADFLARACAGDEELRAEVESLLAHDRSAENFIEESAFEVAARRLADGEARSVTGERIGPYKVVREIGRGGMGVVYLAVRDDDFRKEVAIKLIKRGMDTDAVVGRFRNERQILANLEHLNIARLLDGGMTDDGLPYFVMEYIEGLPIDEYCDTHGLSTDERLRLFRQICAAVTYAHQNLVIHRDLKPINILVTPEGVPKLLDFGIAKVLRPSPEQPATATVAALRALTPEYASPEQIRGEKLTTSTDVYSLGVILYELLTGRRPYETKDTTPEELLRAIEVGEPAKPSKVTDSGQPNSRRRARDSAAAAAQRPLLQHNSKLLRGDLDNVILMALRKEPARRYKSVEQFSEDIGRHLTGLPVIARKDTFVYHASKFIGRNKVTVVAACLIALAIIAGLLVALWQAENARRQRDLAQRERVKAERINEFLHRMLSFSNQSIMSVSPVAQESNVTVNKMLDQIAPQIETELADQPEVRAQVLRTIGSAYASQGRYDSAKKYLSEALRTQIGLYGEENAETASTLTELGLLTYRQQDLEEAAQLLEKAVAFYRKQRQANAPGYSPANLALALDYLGVVKFYQVDPYVGKPLVNEAFQIAADANLQGRERIVMTFIKGELGTVLLYTGDPLRGESLIREAVAEYRQLPGEPRWELGVALTLLGSTAIMKNRLDEAEGLLLEGEGILRRTLGDTNSYLSANLERQAFVLLLKNDLRAAEEKMRVALVMFQAYSPRKKLGGAALMVSLGDILIKAGRTREGEEYYRQALTIYEEQPTKNYVLIAYSKIRLSQFLLSQNRPEEAEQMALTAYNETRQHLDEQHPMSKATAANLIQIYKKLGKSAPL